MNAVSSWTKWSDGITATTAVGVLPRNPEGWEQDLGRRPTVGGLEEHRVGRAACQVPREIGGVARVGDHNRPLRVERDGHTIERLLEQRPRTQERGARAGAMVTVDVLDQRAQAEPLAPGQHNRPRGVPSAMGGPRRVTGFPRTRSVTS